MSMLSTAEQPQRGALEGSLAGVGGTAAAQARCGAERRVGSVRFTLPVDSPEPW